MNYCRHCQKPTIKEAGPCPHCGKELSDSVPLVIDGGDSPAGRTDGRRMDLATGEIMEGSPAAGDLAGGGYDDGPIELDIDPARERAARARPVKAPAAHGKSPAVQASTSAPLEEMASIAGFGPSPDSFFKTAGYMVHVRRRRKALASDIAGIEKQHGAALDDLNANLLKLGTKVEDQAVESGDFGREVEAIREMKTSVSRFRQQRSVEEQDRKGQQDYLDEEISRIEVEAQKFKNEEEIISREAEDAHASRKRVQLRQQRVEIEIRNIKQTMPRPAKGEPPVAREVLAPYERQIAERESALKDIGAELTLAEENVKDVNRKLAMARNAVSEQMGKISLVNRKKEQMVENARQSDAKAQGEFYDMQSRLEELYRTLARTALDAGKIPEGMEGMDEVITARMDAEAALGAKLELYRGAMDSYSHSDFAKGHVLLGLGGALVLTLFILILVIAL